MSQLTLSVFIDIRVTGNLDFDDLIDGSVVSSAFVTCCLSTPPRSGPLLPFCLRVLVLLAAHSQPMTSKVKLGSANML
jgi:hypothetical protein